jgi:lathosterol oxidase
MDEVLELVNIYIVDKFILGGVVASEVHAKNAQWSEDYSIKRQFIVLWAFLYLSTMLIYFVFAGSSFVWSFLTERRDNLAAERVEHHAVAGAAKQRAHTTNPSYWPWDSSQIRAEVWVSTWSLFFMAGMTATVDVYFLMGGSKLYNSVEEYGWMYFCLSPIFFLMFTDAVIYWIHRILHWPSVYWLHKLHHAYKESTPWSAFSFHPLDGFAQSCPYHIFAICFPMHSRLYLFTLFCVGLWTINIHDRLTLRLPGVNGAAHHTIHHTKFNFNYGQYFTLWDQLCGTYKDPYSCWPYELDEGVLEMEKKREQAEYAKEKAARITTGASEFNPDPEYVAPTADAKKEL